MERNELLGFFESQLRNWDLARKNFDALQHIKRKDFKIGDLEGIVQFNPARAVSTLANIDIVSVKKRKCFLCQENRPSEQKSLEILQDWKLLVNPYPILPYHFTIVNNRHIPQKFIFEEGLKLADKLPGMVIFFNDEGAGASAPDHMHFQCVPIEEVPLIRLIDSVGDISELELPFKLIETKEDLEKNTFPINFYFWKKENDKEIKYCGIPRKAHRPDVYYLDPPLRRAVSPGALDMAGIIVVPVHEDFTRITDDDIETIFSQVGFRK